MVLKHLKRLHRKLKSIVNSIFKRRKTIRLGFYGPVNSGKTTIANVICVDWLGERMGKVSRIPHETREIQTKEHVEIKHKNKKLIFNLVDTPGIATKIDFENFLRYGLKKKEARKRAKEATRGVIEAIKWLDRMDLILVVLDARKSPVDQVNVTILGNLEARNIPFVIVGNKIDLKKAKVERIKTAFPQYPVVGISAKTGRNINELYKNIFEVMK